MKKLGIALGFINALVIMGVLGLFVYTRLIYKRPVITELKERNKLVSVVSRNDFSGAHRGYIPLDPLTVNLDPYVDPDGRQKLHYIQLSLAVEIRDEKEAHKFDEIRPFVQDQIIEQLGKKKFEDLNQVQGRYLFRSLIIDATNAYLKEPMVTDVFFTEFIVQ